MEKVTQLKSLSQEKTEYGDGDDGGVVATETIIIRSADNGWIIETFFEDDSSVTEVFDNDGKDNGNIQAVNCILQSMGLESEIKIRG